MGGGINEPMQGPAWGSGGQTIKAKKAVSDPRPYLLASHYNLHLSIPITFYYYPTSEPASCDCFPCGTTAAGPHGGYYHYYPQE